MTIRVGVNGFGRIGRNFFRALDAQQAEGKAKDIEIVAVNDLTDNASLAHLLKFDSILGRLPYDVSLEGEDTIVVGNLKIKALEVKEGPATAVGRPGRRRRRRVDRHLHRRRQGQGPPGRGRQESHHLRAGHRRGHHHRDGRQRRQVRRQPEHHLQRVVHHQLPGPFAKVLNDEFGIVNGPDDHRSTPTPRTRTSRTARTKDLRRARAAALNIVPTSTGAAKAIGLVLPELKGKLDGYALRVPIPTGSCTDLTVELKKAGTADDQRRDEGRRRGPAQRHPEVLRRADRLVRHRHRPAQLDLRRGPDQGHRQPGQGRVVVMTTNGVTPTACGTWSVWSASRCNPMSVKTLDDLLKGVSKVGASWCAPTSTSRSMTIATSPTRPHHRVAAHPEGTVGRRGEGHHHRAPGPPDGARIPSSRWPRWPPGSRRAARPARATGRRCGGNRRAGPGRGLDRRRHPAAGEHPLRPARDQQG